MNIDIMQANDDGCSHTVIPFPWNKSVFEQWRKENLDKLTTYDHNDIFIFVWNTSEHVLNVGDIVKIDDRFILLRAVGHWFDWQEINYVEALNALTIPFKERTKYYQFARQKDSVFPVVLLPEHTDCSARRIAGMIECLKIIDNATPAYVSEDDKDKHTSVNIKLTKEQLSWMRALCH